MIITVMESIKKIFEEGKNFKWEKPAKCCNCNESNLWGHGFVLSFFDGFDEGLYLRRYRCPFCGTVFKLKPAGYFKKFQASIKTIRSSISSRLYNSKYLSFLSSSRQRFWYKALIRNINAYLGNTWSKGLVAGFDKLVSMGKIPVTSSI